MRTLPFSETAYGLQYAITIVQPNQTLRLTTAKDDYVIGGNTFLAKGAVNITNIIYAADGTPTNADVRVAATTTGGIRPGLGGRGLIDGLSIKIEMFDPKHPALGTLDMIPGATIGSVSEDTNRIIVFAVQGRLSLLKAPCCEVHTVVCRARLGDARCKKPLAVGDVVRNRAYLLKDTNPSADAGPWDTWVRKLEGGSYNDRVYQCTTAGTTHPTVAPTYPTTIGATVTDGGAVFTCRQALLVAATGQALDFFNVQLTADVAAAINAAQAAAGLDDVNWTLGNLVPRTGELRGTRIPIKAYDDGTFILTTWQPFAPSNFPVGTTFEVHPGCDRLMVTCRDVHNNLGNMRATPYAPNSDLQTGRA